ncbi:hypothetical protein PoB_007121200 [Plakobranchus ocellatus]|uniref:Uncharacterized protein n=1 Tax=Plakobranchus ocellatus TaxID=259542 RepID=A0AAV4DKY3_9GAST|nr:hypothetical protein PoB_007121200 [Plakobranchus ocellatus]
MKQILLNPSTFCPCSNGRLMIIQNAVVEGGAEHETSIRLQLSVPPTAMSHTLISATVLLASLAAASAIFSPPFLPVFGPRPIVPFFGPRPLLPIIGRRFLPLVPPVVPITRPFVSRPRFQNRQRRRRVTQQISTGRTRPFVATVGGNSVGRQDRPRDDRVTVNLIDGRDTTGPNVYLVDYGRDGFFDGGMDFGLAGGLDVGLGGLNMGPGMDLGSGFLRDGFGGGDVSIDGNVYINGNSKAPVSGAPLGGPVAPLGAPVAAPMGGGVSATDVFDYGLSSMPLDPANMALNAATQGANVPLV